MSKPSTKSYVLQKLEQNKGSYITGMDLALELGVSRNAIWKAINELKKEGYIIHSTNNKGYSLDEGSDILSVTAIRECIESIINSATLSTTTSKEKNIATRTWSTNYSHMHILDNLGFKLVQRDINDRGVNIDTVYYLKNPSIEGFN